MQGGRFGRNEWLDLVRRVILAVGEVSHVYEVGKARQDKIGAVHNMICLCMNEIR